MVGFGEYDRKARLTPGLLAVLPVAFFVLALGLKRYPVVSSATGILTAVGGTYLLAVLVRSIGTKAQEKLWTSWGGPPTTSMLRLRTPMPNPLVREQWRRALSQITNVELPSRQEEDRDPAGADNRIESAVVQVL